MSTTGVKKLWGYLGFVVVVPLLLQTVGSFV